MLSLWAGFTISLTYLFYILWLLKSLSMQIRVNNEPKLIFSNACQVDFHKLLLFAQYNELRNI